MAKILIADDNSNIQKMVGLALKDQGIDVVAVGNGEAAVRKISELHPDLVLADVFMPVRNGYEVCEYVKTDSALAHIPVILLVGAFDPLDEQEAQRVGADGVLKKPFVPPDPLISMVKSALVRAGISYSAASPEKATTPAAIKAADLLAPAANATSPAKAEARAEAVPMVQSEPLPEELPSRPEPLKIDSGSQHLAFGSLLETSSVEEEEPGYVHPVPSELAPERDWRSTEIDEEAEEAEEEEAPKSSWRRDAADEAFDDEPAAGSVPDWQGTPSTPTPAVDHEHESWAPAAEKTNFTEAAALQEGIVAKLTEAKLDVPAAPFSGEAWAAAMTVGSEDMTAVAEEEKPLNEATPAYVAEATLASIDEEAPASAPAESQAAATSEVAAPQPEAPTATSSWSSVAVDPWNAEVQKANQLASAWDTTTAAAPASEPEPAQHETPSAASALAEAPAPAIQETVAEASAVEALRAEAAHVMESTAPEALAPETGHETKPAGDPDMEALVAKVLAKMSPEVLQAVTREILKPVVEALVRGELNAKKP